MNLLDFLIILPILYFCYRGFVNGLIKEVLSIVGIILAVFLTFNYMDTLSGAIRPMFEEDESYIPFISATILFIGTIVLVNLIAYLSKEILVTINLNFVNRLGGLGFGFLKSGILVSALLLLLAGFNVPSQETREDSVTYSYVIYFAPLAYDAVASVYPGAENFTETVQETLSQYNPIENFPFGDK